jgi:PKD repeat protein
MKHIKGNLCTLFILGGLIVSNMAFAVDRKVYPGATCHSYVGSLNDDFDHLSQYIENKNTTNLRLVTCPIVRDNVLNVNGTNAVSIQVNRDNSTTIALSCVLTSWDPIGNYVDSDFASFSGVGQNTLSLNVVTSVVDGYYNVICFLPPLSSIYSYEVEEF